MKIWVAVLLFCSAVGGVSARDRVWDGGGKTRKWSDASNWKPNGVPKRTDDVIFDRTSEKDCDIDVDVEVGSITFSELYVGTVSAGTNKIIVTAGDFVDKKGKFDAEQSTVRFTGRKDQMLHFTFNDKFHVVENAKKGGKLVFFFHTITMQCFRAEPGTTTEFTVGRTYVTDLDLRGKKDDYIILRSNDPEKAAPVRFSGKQHIKYVRFQNIDAHSNGYGPKEIKATYGCIDDGGNQGMMFGSGSKPKPREKDDNDEPDKVKVVAQEPSKDLLPKKMREARKDFCDDLEDLQKGRDAAIRKLTTRYIKELEKGKVYYTRKGDLESARVVKKEIENLKTVLEGK